MQPIVLRLARGDRQSMALHGSVLEMANAHSKRAKRDAEHTQSSYRRTVMKLTALVSPACASWIFGPSTNASMPAVVSAATTKLTREQASNVMPVPILELRLTGAAGFRSGWTVLLCIASADSFLNLRLHSPQRGFDICIVLCRFVTLMK